MLSMLFIWAWLNCTCEPVELVIENVGGNVVKLIIPAVAPGGAEISPPATNALKMALALLAMIASVDELNGTCMTLSS